jgi:hypothetical protein
VTTSRADSLSIETRSAAVQKPTAESLSRRSTGTDAPLVPFETTQDASSGQFPLRHSRTRRISWRIAVTRIDIEPAMTSMPQGKSRV